MLAFRLEWCYFFLMISCTIFFPLFPNTCHFQEQMEKEVECTSRTLTNKCEQSVFMIVKSPLDHLKVFTWPLIINRFCWKASTLLIEVSISFSPTYNSYWPIPGTLPSSELFPNSPVQVIFYSTFHFPYLYADISTSCSLEKHTAYFFFFFFFLKEMYEFKFCSKDIHLLSELRLLEVERFELCCCVVQ